jgi:hypothetical protein
VRNFKPQITRITQATEKRLEFASRFPNRHKNIPAAGNVVPLSSHLCNLWLTLFSILAKA